VFVSDANGETRVGTEKRLLLEV